MAESGQRTDYLKGNIMKGKDWLLKLSNDRNKLTLCVDGYVYYNHKKLFVLKKLAMQEINDVLNGYDVQRLDALHDSKCTIKCKGKTKFTSHDEELFNKLVRMIYKSDNIKHPPVLLGEVISLIEELRAAGTLKETIQAETQDAFIDRLIDMCRSGNQ